MKKLIYCHECEEEKSFRIQEELIETTIKGETFSYNANIAYCQDCNEEVYIKELSDRNIEVANREYRKVRGILQVEEIEEILNKYNIGKKTLAKLLGWGETTVIRYLDGMPPTKEYNEKLKQLQNPLNMLEVFEQNGTVLSETSRKKLSESLNDLVRLNENKEEMSSFTIARYFLSKVDFESGLTISPLKLQKLMYYAQSWALAIIERPLFSDDFQAWQHGPVIDTLYYMFKSYIYNNIPKVSDFDEKILKHEELEVLEIVWKAYGKYDAKYLEALTHSEDPWRLARCGYKKTDKCNEIITQNSIREFYSNIKKTYNIKNSFGLDNYINDIEVLWD